MNATEPWPWVDGRRWCGDLSQRAEGGLRWVPLLMRVLAGLVGLGMLCGCETARFYSQAVTGQWELVVRRERVDGWLAREETSGALREGLQLATELRHFAAEELGLPTGGAYRHYVDLGREYVVWNVFAAPEFSLEAKCWWYPVVGRLEYRGYFREDWARAYGRRLESKGYEVYVGGVTAYSTLGWFRDPLLSTFIFLPELELADLLFHELAHQRLFFRGDTEVNEAFATVVAREGVRRWLAAGGRWEELAAIRAEQERDDAVADLIQATRRRLERLYADPPDGGVEALRGAKAGLLERMRAEYEELKRAWPGYDGYDGWMAGRVNNARLNAVEVYARWVPVLERMLAGVGGDLPEFYRMMERLGGVAPPERQAILAWLEVTTDQVSD